ncbi:hypothetical protein MOPEL_096_00820 [Mobilicoccus pelagius NBRC 104925]|uniref:Uncharacterized protein n=1 Tax=Mobilicoccus pelagius NBRC 104925 TaxID=1089455 RepID=H5UTL7_9MICO|nr:hypothetical protein MOPEL_096_00820 [Mobilicoccus pelagius NBRC 104925]
MGTRRRCAASLPHNPGTVTCGTAARARASEPARRPDPTRSICIPGGQEAVVEDVLACGPDGGSSGRSGGGSSGRSEGGSSGRSRGVDDDTGRTPPMLDVVRRAAAAARVRRDRRPRCGADPGIA